MIGRPQQVAPRGLLPELKSGDRGGDQISLGDSEYVGNAFGQAAGVLGVVLKMIQPDLKVRKHGTALVATVSHCERRLRWSDGAIQANSGTLGGFYTGVPPDAS